MNYKIAIIGLGYVGLPLAVEFAKKYNVLGFDINVGRISNLNQSIDKTLEVESHDLKAVLKNNDAGIGLYCTNDVSNLRSANIYIVTVPTPVDVYNKPDFTPLIKASETIGKNLNEGDIVIYESTVYPGATEEICVPILEQFSQLIYNKNFSVGYSPERINPGDKEHTVSKILKVTSGSNAETAEIIDKLYGSIILAGTFKASSIKVAEAAKVIENSQRDINIAFVNELAKIFNKLNIPTNEVLAAAATKWNFLNFKPGLVGGHCIGVDPYYLAQKAQEAGYHPEIILAGRRMNDSMGEYVAQELIKLMINKEINIKNSAILVLGATFKENCPDVRNTKVVDILNNLKSYHTQVTVWDPWVDSEELMHEYGWASIKELDKTKKYDAILCAVAHDEFKSWDIAEAAKPKCAIYDAKGALNSFLVDKKL